MDFCIIWKEYGPQKTGVSMYSALDFFLDNVFTLIELIGGLIFFYALWFIKDLMTDWLNDKKNDHCDQ